MSPTAPWTVLYALHNSAVISALSWNCDKPRYIVNRKYSKLRKELRDRFSDFPDYYVKVPCGNCALCKKQVANSWRFRLVIECRNTDTHIHMGRRLPRVMFITFTFREDCYTDDEKLIAPWLVRFRDSYRKRFGKSPRYFAITDRGSENGRVHLHMLLFNPRIYDKKQKSYTKGISVNMLHDVACWWPYGFVDIEWVREPQVANYVCGYITGANINREEPIKHGKPICEAALRYKPKIYPSKGLGSQYINPSTIDYHFYNEEFRVQLDGYFYALPRYYYDKIWTYSDLQMKSLKSIEENMAYCISYGLNPLKFMYRTNNQLVNSRLLSEQVANREKFVTLVPPKVEPLPIEPPFSVWGDADITSAEIAQSLDDINNGRSIPDSLDHYILYDGQEYNEFIPF